MSAGDFVSIRLGNQDFGISVAVIRDVLRKQTLTPVPLAPHAVAGLLNLRGRIVTAIDLRQRLGLEPGATGGENVIVVVEHGAELYALIADAVGDVHNIEEGRFEPLPLILDPLWRDVAAAVYPVEHGLIVLLDIARLLEITPKLRAAG